MTHSGVVSVWLGLAAGAVVGALAAAGCGPTERVVNYKPFMSGLDGVQTQAPEVRERQKTPEIVNAEAMGPESLVTENPDGSKTLHSRNGLHLMWHLQRTLADNDADLFAGQVLCDLTRQEYLERGMDPREAFVTLKPQEKEIAKLFARMPLGENSPNVLRSIIGRNMFRVQLTGKSTEGLEWTGFDMVLEKGNWRLRWLVR